MFLFRNKNIYLDGKRSDYPYVCIFLIRWTPSRLEFPFNIKSFSRMKLLFIYSWLFLTKAAFIYLELFYVHTYLTSRIHVWSILKSCLCSPVNSLFQVKAQKVLEIQILLFLTKVIFDTKLHTSLREKRLLQLGGAK